MSARVVWARQPLPPPGAPSVFLAGPTRAYGDRAPTWRVRAIELLAARWAGATDLAVLVPESLEGKRAARYEDQFEWECAGRALATMRLFWIPRDVVALPGFTTNVEFGHDVVGGRVVLGAPPDCPNPERNRYLVALARRYGAPVRETLEDTVDAALTLM